MIEAEIGDDGAGSCHQAIIGSKLEKGQGMRAIFLDIDGVLVTKASAERYRAGSRFPFERRSLDALERLVAATDATIVLSSSWRKFPDDLAMLASAGILASVDVPRTPIHERGGLIVGRGEEIDGFLAGVAGVSSYVILDDLDDFRPHHAAHLVLTHSDRGLDVADVHAAVAILARPASLPEAATLRLLPDPVLRTICAPLEAIDVKTANLVNAMFARLDSLRGIGLAAPQVGQSVRLFVMSIPDRDRPGRLLRRICINPRIASKSDDLVASHEGCLSIPGKRFVVSRSAWIELEFTEVDGVTQVLRMQGLEAICGQHEIDHLDGVLVCDRSTGRPVAADI